MERVLIVDDHAGFRTAARRLLGSTLHVVGEAQDGAEAKQLFRTVEPTLVLVDVQLPDVNGIDLALELRALRPEAKIVLISSRDQVEYSERLSGTRLPFIWKPNLSIEEIVASAG